MRILSLYWGFGLGGGVRYASILNYLNNTNKFKVKHVCLRSSKWSCDKKILSEINAKTVFIKSKLDIRYIYFVVKEVIQFSPDLIMTHGFNSHFVILIASLFFRTKKINKVCSYHGRYHPQSFQKILLSKLYDRFTEYYIQNHAFSVVAVSKYSYNNLKNKKIDTKKIFVIHNGLPLKMKNIQEKNNRKEWNISKDDFLLGTVSRLDSIKGIDYLIKAMSIINKKDLNIKLVVVGSGLYKRKLLKKVKMFQLCHKVIFAGKRNDIERCLNSFDVYILPSLDENHSISLLEAMRSKKTIIATNVGGNIESVRNMKEALIVPPANSYALYDAIKKLYDNPLLRDFLSINAHNRFCKKFHSGLTIRKTEQWLTSCMNKCDLSNMNDESDR